MSRADRVAFWSGLGMAAAVASLALGWWIGADPTAAFVELVPGTDGSSADRGGPVDDVVIGELFEHFSDELAPAAGHWPRFRGPASDNIADDPVPLARSWADGGPPVLWSVELGEGHAAPAVWRGRVFVLDYDETGGADALRCFSLADGHELWRRSYKVKLKRNHGLSRTVPAVSDAAVVTVGPRGHVMAVAPETGDLLWTLDLEREYGSEAPFWYTGQCPLIDDGVAVIAPAGSALLLGLDAATGELLWSTPNPDGWAMSHTSVVPATLGGRRQYVYSALGGMVGVAADGPERGQVLWTTELWSHSVLAPSPLALPGDRLFVSAGYGAGSAVLGIERSGEAWTVSKLAGFAPGEGMASEQQTPILWRGAVFSVQPKDAGELREELVCWDAADCTTVRWSSGTTERFGLGPYLLAGDVLFVLDDEGVLTLAETSTDGYRRLARAKVLPGPDAWGPLALAGGRLLARDAHRLVCLDVSAGGVA